MKANHNYYCKDNNNIIVVSEYQRYKFWKQITTALIEAFTNDELYQNIKDIKFESKSQHLAETVELSYTWSKIQYDTWRRKGNSFLPWIRCFEWTSIDLQASKENCWGKIKERISNFLQHVLHFFSRFLNFLTFIGVNGYFFLINTNDQIA